MVEPPRFARVAGVRVERVREVRHPDAVHEERRDRRLLGAAGGAGVPESGRVECVERGGDAAGTQIPRVVRRRAAPVEPDPSQVASEFVGCGDQRGAGRAAPDQTDRCARHADRRLHVADRQVGAADHRRRGRQQAGVVEPNSGGGECRRGGVDARLGQPVADGDDRDRARWRLDPHGLPGDIGTGRPSGRGGQRHGRRGECDHRRRHECARTSPRLHRGRSRLSLGRPAGVPLVRHR